MSRPWEPNQHYPNPTVEALDPSFAKYRLMNAGVEWLAARTRWGEGPV